MEPEKFAKQYRKALTFMAAGKHGTPQWNPVPHPEADPAVVANRDSDPLWAYHRGWRGSNAFETVENGWSASLDRPKSESPIIRSQHHVGYSDDPPVGFHRGVDSELRWKSYRIGNTQDADLQLSHNNGEQQGHLSFRHPSNNPNYQKVWGQGGSRPWWNTVFPLQDLENFALPHDPYRLLAISVKSGNRHALPELVNLLQKRDNPSGWSPEWSKLAKAMEERVGDLPLPDVLRRANAISEATGQHSQNPHEHQQIAAAAREGGDPTGYLAMADHMQENGLPQYAQLLKAELANVIPSLRRQPRRKGSRL